MIHRKDAVTVESLRYCTSRQHMISIRSFQPSINITSEIGATQGKRGMRRQRDPTLWKKWEELRASWIDPCQEAGGESISSAPRGEGWAHPGGGGGSRCLPGHPRRVPSPVGAGHRPHEPCGAVPGTAPPNRAPDSTKISTLPTQPWADTALLA